MISQHFEFNYFTLCFVNFDIKISIVLFPKIILIMSRFRFTSGFYFRVFATFTSCTVSFIENDSNDSPIH